MPAALKNIIRSIFNHVFVFDLIEPKSVSIFNLAIFPPLSYTYVGRSTYYDVSKTITSPKKGPNPDADTSSMCRTIYSRTIRYRC